MIKITSPINREVLTHRNGQLEDGGLIIKVCGLAEAKEGTPVFVNGRQATVSKSEFHEGMAGANG